MEKQRYFNVIKNYKKMCSNLIANICAYESWSYEFSRSQIKDLYGKLIKEFDGVDFTQFTLEELKQFDFGMWDDDIILMPAWAIDCLKDGTKVVSIDGDEVIFDKSKGLDKDVRFGCTAWGFNRSQLRDGRIEEVLNG